MAKKIKEEKKQFFIKNKEIITDDSAPIVSDEFVTEDGKYQGQTVEVKSDTHLEDDQGSGEALVMRTFEFGAIPGTFAKYQKDNGHLPYAQEIFQSHLKGIQALLWQDGLAPMEEMEPRIILSKKSDKYLIMVWARPQLGQTLVHKPKTLSEIANDGKQKAGTKQGAIA